MGPFCLRSHRSTAGSDRLKYSPLFVAGSKVIPHPSHDSNIRAWTHVVNFERPRPTVEFAQFRYRKFLRELTHHDLLGSMGQVASGGEDAVVDRRCSSGSPSLASGLAGCAHSSADVGPRQAGRPRRR